MEAMYVPAYPIRMQFVYKSQIIFDIDILSSYFKTITHFITVNRFKYFTIAPTVWHLLGL